MFNVTQIESLSEELKLEESRLTQARQVDFIVEGIPISRKYEVGYKGGAMSQITYFSPIPHISLP